MQHRHKNTHTQTYKLTPKHTLVKKQAHPTPKTGGDPQFNYVSEK